MLEFFSLTFKMEIKMEKKQWQSRLGPRNVMYSLAAQCALDGIEKRLAQAIPLERWYESGYAQFG